MVRYCLPCVYSISYLYVVNYLVQEFFFAPFAKFFHNVHQDQRINNRFCLQGHILLKEFWSDFQNVNTANIRKFSHSPSLLYFSFSVSVWILLNSLPFIHDVKHVGTYKRWVDDMKILLFYNKINVDPSLLIILNLTAMKYIFDHIFRQKLLCKYVSVIIYATLTHWEFFLYSSIMKRKI